MTTDPFLALYAGGASGQETRWSAGQPIGTPVTVTYSFRDTISPSYPYASGEPIAATFAAFTQAARAITREVLKSFEQVCGLRFEEVADGSGAMIEYGSYAQSGGGTGYTPVPDGNGGFAGPSGDVWVDTSRVAGAGAAFLVAHETMHALGLKHPHGGNNSDYVLDPSLDSLRATTMSYAGRAGVVVHWNGQRVIQEVVNPSGPGVLDAAALRHIYGPSRDTHTAGDDTYRYDDTPALRLLADNGGNDTIDLRAITHAADLDLRAGHRSMVSTWTLEDWAQTLISQGMPAAEARAFVGEGSQAAYGFYGDTFAIAAGTIIENVIGGPRGDRLTGNEADNVFAGAGGDDRIDGDAGFDTAVFAGNRSAYALSGGGASWTVAGADGSDSLQHIEAFRFADRTVFALSGADATLARLYAAAFARAPDAGGLAVQIHAAAAGLSPLQIAANFLGSAEFVARYGAAPGSEAYVDALYLNVLGRAGEPGGRAVQLEALAHGLSRAQLLLNFADSAENRARVEGDWLFV